MKIYSLPYTQDFQFITLRVASFAQEIQSSDDVMPGMVRVGDEVRAFALSLINQLERLQPHEE